MKFLTSRRARNYPRVVLIVVWAAILINGLAANGWRGWGGQLLFPDFLVFYGAGALFRTEPPALYSFGRQLSLQQSLIAPTSLTATGPFVHPPYVASLLWPLSFIPYAEALVLWVFLSCVALVATLVLLRRHFLDELSALNISAGALAVITLSLAATVLGLYSGQMHTFILVGSIAVIVLTLRGHPWAAGFLVGLLAVKPQTAFGFSVLFLARGQWRACAAIAAGFASLNVPLITHAGLHGTVALYGEYLETARAALFLPFDAGFPRSLLMTPYGFLAVVSGREHQDAAFVVANILALVIVIWFVIDARRLRADGTAALRLSFAFAMLLPFLVFPYLMLYDAVSLLVAALVLIPSATVEDRMKMAAQVYGFLWVCAPVSAAIGLPLGGLAPVALWVRAQSERRRVFASVDATFRCTDDGASSV